jgi:hypothetical protein
MYLALTIFADAAETIVDRVVHLDDGSYWLAKAAEMLGRPIKEGETLLGVRVDRIGSEILDDFNYVGSRHHY